MIRALSVALLFGFVLVGCETNNDPAVSSTQAPVTVQFRQGTRITARAGTSLDTEELQDRNYFATTFNDSLAQKWMLTEGTYEEDTIPEKIVNIDLLGSLHVVVAANETVNGTDCLVIVHNEDGKALYFTRPEAEFLCPTEVDSLKDWIPEVSFEPQVEPEDISTSSSELSYGSYVGTFNNITAYSNGSNGYYSGVYSCCGVQWQCVEYANRYYYQSLGHTNLKGTGNANTYYSTASNKGLVAFVNGGTVPPAVGDMLPSNGGAYGHIAIVREVGSNYIKVIHQNWANDTSDNVKTLSMTASNGKYTVAGFSSSYPVQGWLRKTSVTSVTPSYAYLNQKTTFTVNGTNLPSTLAAWIADCDGLTFTSLTSSKATFTCTPKWTTGSKAGTIKAVSGGTVLRNFSITVY